MFFHRFINYTTSEQWDVPADVHRTPEAALAYLYKVGSIGYADRVQYMGRQYIQYVRV